jgi:hypothetical protein
MMVAVGLAAHFWLGFSRLDEDVINTDRARRRID